MHRARFFLVVAVVFAATVFSCFASSLPTASPDIVPRENWTYDAMIHLAARDLVPGATANTFEGQWLYSREEMADFIARSIDSASDTTPSEGKSLLGKLATEFRPELILLHRESVLEKAEPWLSIKTVVPAGFLDARIVDRSGDTELSPFYRATGLASIGKYTTAGVTLDNERWRFDGHEFSVLDKYFVAHKTRNWEWEIGRDSLWWGPEYNGGLILSDNSPGFLMAKIGKDFSLGPMIGHIKVTQFVSSWEDQNARYFLYGRRFEKRFSGKFYMAFSETAKTTDIHPNPLIAVLPSFYLYQHIFEKDIDTKFNDFMSMDAWYRFSPGFEGYADWLIDDMQAPWGFYSGPSWHRPRKTGWLLGGHWPNLTGDGKTSLRAEGILIDSGTYEAWREQFPGLSYTHDGQLIGSPVGPNSEAIFIRANRQLAPHWNASVEFLKRKPRTSTGADPFDTSRLGLYLSRELTPRFTTWLRYDRLRTTAKEDRLQLSGSWAL